MDKTERGRIQGLPKFYALHPIISGIGKAKNCKFCTHIHRIARNKSPLKISGKVTVAVLRDSRKFSGHAIYRAHRAVIFAIARLSCLLRVSILLAMHRAALAMIEDSVRLSDRPTVCLSDTRWYHAKTTPATIMRSSMEDSPMTLVS